MMITQTVSSIPLSIHQYFSSKMLSLPCPKLRDDSETLRRVYLWIKTKLMKKCAKYPEWKRECEQLEKQFLELYERALAKEKDLEAKEGYKTQESFYWITISDRRSDNIFRRLKLESYKIPFELWRNNEISSAF
jgi:hypothetical protein